MVDAPENIGLVRGMLGLRLWNKHDDNDQSNAIAYTRSDLVAELAAENERLTKERDEAERLKINWFETHLAHQEANQALGKANSELLKRAMDAERRIESLASTGAVKALEWSNHPAGGEQALGAGLGLYRVHANGNDWYLVPDHMGTGGKAAAQADFERRILSTLEPHPRATNTVDAHETANVSDKPEGQQEPVAWRVTYANGETVFLSDKPTGDSGVYECLPLYTRPSEQATADQRKEIILLNIVSRMGDSFDCTESKWSFLNWFCDDALSGGTDTFNRCIEKGWIATSHDSDTDVGTGWLTDAGRAALKAAMEAGHD